MGAIRKSICLDFRTLHTGIYSMCCLLGMESLNTDDAMSLV